MSQYWQCSNCGAVLQKGLSPEKIAKYKAAGRAITGNATCGECGATFSKADVYDGLFDVDPAALGLDAPAADPAGESDPFAAAPADGDFDDLDEHFETLAEGADPHSAAGHFADANDDDDDAFFEAPPPHMAAEAATAAAFGDPGSGDAVGDMDDLSDGDAPFDLLADLNQEVAFGGPAGGTMVDYVLDDIRAMQAPYELPESGYDEFWPTLGPGVHCDICARHLAQPEGYLLTTDEVTASEDFLDLVVERWMLNGWLPEMEWTDQTRDAVRADLHNQGGDHPWLACEDCILLFSAVRGDALTTTAQEARNWWPHDGVRPDDGTRPAASAAGAAAGYAAVAGAAVEMGYGEADPNEYYEEDDGGAPPEDGEEYSDEFAGDYLGDEDVDDLGGEEYAADEEADDPAMQTISGGNPLIAQAHFEAAQAPAGEADFGDDDFEPLDEGDLAEDEVPSEDAAFDDMMLGDDEAVGEEMVDAEDADFDLLDDGDVAEGDDIELDDDDPMFQ